MIMRKHSLNNNFHWDLETSLRLKGAKNCFHGGHIGHRVFLVIDYQLGGVSMSVFGQFVVQDMGAHVCVVFTDFKGLTNAL